MNRREGNVTTIGDGRLPTPPAALYPCSREGCREDRTWPPDDLTWCNGRQEKLDDNGDVEHFTVDAGWYCGECTTELGIEADGPRLDEVLGSHARPAEADSDTARPRHQAYRLAGRTTSAEMCGTRFANPQPDANLPAARLVCTCAPGHRGPHVAHVGDLPAAIAFDAGGPAARIPHAVGASE